MPPPRSREIVRDHLASRSPGNADTTWLENPWWGQDLRRVIYVNQFPLSG